MLARYTTVMCCLLFASHASAQITRVSTATDGAPANGPSDRGVISGNGRFVAFTSVATNLVANDTNGAADVFVRDLVGLTTTRVSVASDGSERVGDSTVGGISDDGTIVVFTSKGAFADGVGATSEFDHIWVHDRTNGQTVRVSVAGDGTPGNLNSRRPSITGDGRYVVFESDAGNLVAGDTNAAVDVFLHDRTTHVTTRVSVGQDGRQGLYASRFPAISADGSTVAFGSVSVSFGDAQDGNACSPPGCEHAFVKQLASGALRRLGPADTFYYRTTVTELSLDEHGQHLAVSGHVAVGEGENTYLSVHDLETGSIASLGTIALRPAYNLYHHTAALSRNGRYLAAGPSDLWFYDRVTDTTELQAIGPAILSTSIWPSFDVSGRYVAFTSGKGPNLSSGPPDTNNFNDVFVLDRDEDGDGMPTNWEQLTGLDPKTPNGNIDADGDSLTNLQEYQAGTLPTATQTRYFAEGATNGFFGTRVAIVNPTANVAYTQVRLLGANGRQASFLRIVQPQKRATVDLSRATSLPDTTFSIIVESSQAVVADRLVWWDSTAYGSHLETATDMPRTTWYFAEGSTGGPYSLFYQLQNPGPVDSSVTVTYLRPAPQLPIMKTHIVPAHSRYTIDVAGDDPDLAAAEVSATITASQPIVAERAMYFTRPGQLFAAGHGGMGIPAPATRWFLAEGATGFFDEYVLIANPDAARADITVTYLREGQPPLTESFQVPSKTRYSLDLKHLPQLASTAVSAIVESTNATPVVVERVMWWPAGTDNWIEASLSAGVTATGTKWALAEGDQGGPFGSSTYIQIANTDMEHDGWAQIRFLADGEWGIEPVTVQILKGSRTTVDVGAIRGLENRSFGAIIETNVPSVVERALYFTNYGVHWKAGATSVATNITTPQ